MAHDENVLGRLTPEEFRLVHNFRIVSAVRQDSILFFSDELVKLEAEDLAASPDTENVVLLTRQK